MDIKLMTVNVRGANFFTIFKDQHKMMSVATNQLLNNSHQEEDQFNIDVRKLYYNLKAPSCDNDNKLN